MMMIGMAFHMLGILALMRHIRADNRAASSSHAGKDVAAPVSGVNRKKSTMNVMLSSDSDSDHEPPKKLTPAKTSSVSPRKTSIAKRKISNVIMSSEEDEEPVKSSVSKPRASLGKAAAKARPAKRGRTMADTDDDDSDAEEEEEKPKKPTPTASSKKAPVKKEVVKKEAKPSNEANPPAKKPKCVTFCSPTRLAFHATNHSFAAFAAKRAAGPAAPGSKAVPDGEPNCLAGLTLVFTGELTAFSRDEAIDLAKRYGAYVTCFFSEHVGFLYHGF